MYYFIYNAFAYFDLQIRLSASCVIGVDFLAKDTRLNKITVLKIPLVAEIIRQLDNYRLDGKYKFNLPLMLSGSEHQIKVYKQMLYIPAGQTISYKNIALNISSSPRAVGNSCGCNPIPLFVPCHRVIASNGLIGGFMLSIKANNILIKQWLLHHEGVIIKDILENKNKYE